jgi:hypothetical protein
VKGTFVFSLLLFLSDATRGDVHVELIAASANGGNIGFAAIPADVTAAARKRPRKGAEVPANLPTIRAKSLIFLME